ncbi:hypothetical protein PG996_011022 [Apiospora saccharicola]|uniref:C2H2-type domain-containing protein n=1 Tax=Apiospora saccharicola TaxID=335842 RepID=A0ABR1UDV1_9PEZI
MIAQHTQIPQDTKSLQPPLVRSTMHYHYVLRSLVSKQSLLGLPSLDFLAFKEEFGPTAFMCHTNGCEKSVSGFSSHDFLKGHEARHSQPLHCFETGCSYNDVGFRTPRELRNHARKRHPFSSEFPVPKRLRSRLEVVPDMPEHDEPEPPTQTPITAAPAVQLDPSQGYMENPGDDNVLHDFDFDSFLHDNDGVDGGFDFNPSTFMEGLGEIGAE